MRDSLDTRYWITWAGSILRGTTDDGDVSSIASALGVADRTVRHWRATNQAPPWALRVLMLTVSGIPAYAENWAGWTFKRAPGGAVLGGPDGAEWTPAELAGYGLTHQRVRALERLVSPGAQLTWSAPGDGQRTAWPGDAVPTWRQLEDAIRLVLEDVLRRAA